MNGYMDPRPKRLAAASFWFFFFSWGICRKLDEAGLASDGGCVDCLVH